MVLYGLHITTVNTSVSESLMVLDGLHITTVNTSVSESLDGT